MLSSPAKAGEGDRPKGGGGGKSPLRLAALATSPASGGG